MSANRPLFFNSQHSIGKSVGIYRRMFADRVMPSEIPLVLSEFLVVTSDKLVIKNLETKQNDL
jgi:hypothetical protein